jgi:sigma-54 dependent transcriptional regulator, flagellar regulatory protein
MQSKLLRMIQERVYEPVGSTRPVQANFRLVAATNRDLEAEVAAGRFRQDLYFRLFVCPIHLPALRERPGDIWILFEHFWRLKGETREVSPEIIELMQTYAWPGNVREMENLAERLSVCASGERPEVTDLPSNVRGIEIPFEVVDHELTAHQSNEDLRRLPVRQHLFEPMRELNLLSAPRAAAFHEDVEVIASAAPFVPAAISSASSASSAPMLPVDLQGMLRQLEESYIAQALSQSNGNKALAAKMLGMQRTTLAEKLRRRSKRDHASDEAFATI